MAYEMIITADSFKDFKAHIIALEEMFTVEVVTGGTTDPIMPEVKKAAAVKAKAEPAKPDPVKPDPVKPVAEIPAAKEPEPVVEETKVEEPAAETSDAPLDFQKDVLPRVFKLTEAHGRDAVVAVLSEFGVPKASQVPPEKFAEFVAAVNKAIG